MSTLQISLAIFGGLVLAGVIAYNTWVARQNTPRKPQGPEPVKHNTENSRFQDTVPYRSAALLDTLPGELPGPSGQRIEPVLPTAPALKTPAVASTPAQDSAPASAPAPRPVILPSSRNLPAADKTASLDALIDVITPLHLEHPVSGEALLNALPGTRRMGSKPFMVEGQRGNGEWEALRPEQRYRQLQAGLQLANRSGALNKIEFSEFIVKMQAFADAVGATPEFPDMQAEVARARELDAFASERDAQLGFTVRTRRNPWSQAYVVQQASRMGFVRGALPGRMVLPGSFPGQPPILSLNFETLTDDPKAVLHSVVLTLEVTHVARSEQPFVRMREIANFLAKSMDGVLTDDAGQLLNSESMDIIGADLERLYDALDSRDLAAGSPQARRLFS